jgi:hypothetical protein
LDCTCAAGCPACIGPEVGQLITPHGEVVTHSPSHVSRKRVIAELLDALSILARH